MTVYVRIVDVDYIKGYELLITFNDGTRKKVDLKPHLKGEVFGELLDKNKFIQYGLTHTPRLNGQMVQTWLLNSYMR